MAKPKAASKSEKQKDTRTPTQIFATVDGIMSGLGDCLGKASQWLQDARVRLQSLATDYRESFTFDDYAGAEIMDGVVKRLNAEVCDLRKLGDSMRKRIKK